MAYNKRSERSLLKQAERRRRAEVPWRELLKPERRLSDKEDKKDDKKV